MSLGDRVKMWVVILAIVALCAYIAKPAAAQHVPAEAGDGNWLINSRHPLPDYFWDRDTNLCFAFITSHNLYGSVTTIANVPCTDEVRRVIKNRP